MLRMSEATLLLPLYTFMARTRTTLLLNIYSTFSECTAIVAPRAAPCWNCFETETKNTPWRYGSLSYRDSRRSHSAEELLRTCNMQSLSYNALALSTRAQPNATPLSVSSVQQLLITYIALTLQTQRNRAITMDSYVCCDSVYSNTGNQHKS
jgi:hypothetical protein